MASWASRNVKLILGLIALLLIAFFTMRLTHTFFQIRSFLLGMAFGMLVGVIPYIRYRWFRKKKAQP